MKKFLALFLALEIRRHSVFEDQWNESIFFVGGEGSLKFDSVDGCLQVEWMNAEQQKMWPETLHLGIIRMTAVLTRENLRKTGR